MRRAITIILSCFVMAKASFAITPERDSLSTIKGRVSKAVPEAGRGKNFTVGLQGAVVQLLYINKGEIDSLYTITGRNGEFLFRGLKPQRIGLRIQNMGYKPISGVYDIQSGENAFFFTMEEQVEVLEGAAITAELPLIRQLEDTTIYNTRILQAADEDNLRQILEILPGFEVRGEAIYVDGHKVSRTYVNGTLVFGDKVTTAIDALKADEVTQVKVYDEISDIDKHRGMKNAKKSRVLDIITKDNILSMTLASAGVAGGADCTGQLRYAAAGVLQFHSEMFQSESMIDCSNLKGIDDSHALNARALVSQPGPLDSYKESQYVNLTNTKYWKDRYYGNSLTICYQLTHEHDKSASTALQEYFGLEQSPTMTVRDTVSNTSDILMHKGSLWLALKDTPIKSIEIRTDFSLGHRMHDMFLGNHTNITNLAEQRTHQNSGCKEKDSGISVGINWTNNDTKRWRPFAGISADLSNKPHINWTIDTLQSSFLNRKLSSEGFGFGSHIWLQAGTMATLANNKDKTTRLSLIINSQYDHSKHRQLSYDGFGVDIPVMDMANSFDFTNNQLKNSIEARFDISTKNERNLYVTGSVIDALLIDNERLPLDFSNTKHFPSIAWEVKYSSRQLSLSASSSAITPSIEQIRNRVSDANPLSLTVGNPYLKQGYNIAAYAQYTPQTFQKGMWRNSSFSASVSGSITLRPIVTKVLYFTDDTKLTEYDGYVAHAGSILNTFNNSRLPRINVSAQVSFAKNIVRHGLKYEVSLINSYLRSPMYNSESLCPLNENNLQSFCKLTYVPSSRLRINNTATIAYLISSRKDKVLSGRLHIGNTFSARWFITGWLKLEAKYSLLSYQYTVGAGNNHFHHIMDTGLSAPISKEFEIGLWGYDLFKSGTLYTTEVNSLMMSQIWTPTYGRNIMLKLVYQFRHKN